jgi:hypothetical protein
MKTKIRRRPTRRSRLRKKKRSRSKKRRKKMRLDGLLLIKNPRNLLELLKKKPRKPNKS